MVAVEPSLTGELVSMESLAGERLHNQALPREFYDGRHSRTIRLVGEEAVKEGLINEVGGIREALQKLNEEIEKKKK